MARQSPCYSVNILLIPFIYSADVTQSRHRFILKIVLSFTDDNNDRKSQKVLNELENIDDECDQLGVAFVKIDNDDEAKEYGIDKVPALLYFEKGIPTYYEGNLEEEEKVLQWLHYQSESDQIEDITDEMLDMIIDKMQYVAVLFCK